MTGRRSHYAELIDALETGEDARHIEGFMRLEYGTLDHLDRQRFDGLARECAQAVAADRDLAESNAQSYGL